MEYHNQGLFFSNLGVDANRENNAGQLEVRRNLYLDIPSSLNSSKVHARVIRISIKNQQRNGVENKIQIFLDWVAIYRAVDLHTKITMYGVRYILIHTEKESFGYLSKSVSVSAREEALKIKSFLDIVGSFRQVHQDNGTYVYENMRYKGIVFAINAASTRHPLNIDFDSPPNASVSYSRPDPNTLVLGVTVGEPCRVVISQSYYRKWTVTEGNGKPAIDPLMGTCSIPLEQGTHVVTLHFQSYEESLALLPLFYIPLSLIVMSILTNRYGWRRYLKSRMAFVFLFYGLGLLSLFILSYFGLAGFQVDFDPIGQSLILVGFSIAGFAAFVWLPLRRWANLGLERTASRHWRQLLKFSSAAASAMKRPAAILSLSIASLLLVVIPLLMHRAIGGVWEYGVFRGYALYLTQLGKIAVSLNVLLMMTLTILFWPRDEGMLSVRTVLPISTLSSAAVSLRLATNQYVFMPLEPFRNELLFILLVTFLTTNLLILNMRYGSILVVRKGFAIEKMLPHSLIEALGILTIALAVLATIIQHFNGFISQLLGQGAFYTFLFVVLLHVATQTLQVSRERMT